MSSRGEGTRAVRAGLPTEAQGDPFLPGPTFAGTYHLRGDPEESEYVYGRYGNPTWTRYEGALGELEDAETVLFASGMAAVSAVLLTALRPGDALLMPSDCYLGVRRLADEYLAGRGVEVGMAPTSRLAEQELPERLRVLWLETPSNPGLDVCDVEALAAAGHERGALVAVDNTFATPFGQRPLDLGADVSVTSATKALSGHSDLLLGSVATRDGGLADSLRGWRSTTGAIPGPFETWLAHRSLATLHLRLDRACTNAQAIAELLEARADVTAVRYPGLPGDPAHELASRQMQRFGAIVAFDLGSRQRAERLLDAAELVTEATSFGGLHTMAERRGRWGADDVPEGFVRLSAGCEDTQDLQDDIRSALDLSRA
jgi:cystathionine gamma-lyase